jgi:hypothetical protein
VLNLQKMEERLEIRIKQFTVAIIEIREPIHQSVKIYFSRNSGSKVSERILKVKLPRTMQVIKHAKIIPKGNPYSKK